MPRKTPHISSFSSCSFLFNKLYKFSRDSVPNTEGTTECTLMFVIAPCPPCPPLPSPALPCLLPCPLLPSPALHSPALPCPPLPSPALPCPPLPCPPMPSHAFPCPLLPCPRPPALPCPFLHSSGYATAHRVTSIIITHPLILKKHITYDVTYDVM